MWASKKSGVDKKKKTQKNRRDETQFDGNIDGDGRRQHTSTASGVDKLYLLFIKCSAN